MRIVIGGWVVLFLGILAGFSTWDGGINPGSRFATLEAMASEQGFSIDKYVDWALIDWARMPDGHYYSNKAPGPMFAAFPFYLALDRLRDESTAIENHEGIVRRRQLSPNAKLAISLLTQALPFALLFAIFFAGLWSAGLSPSALLFFALAFLFGTTPALYMNVFAGHGFSTWLALATVFLLIQRRDLLAGVAGSWFVLSEYSAPFLMPAFAALVVARGRSQRRSIALWLLGSLPALGLWCWYHTACFGAPWFIAHKFQNPQFVESGYEFMGEFRFLPNPMTLLHLLFGWYRGLLFTQPWLLVVAGLLAWRPSIWRADNELRQWTLFATVGLIGLLVMNSLFAGWDGGAAAGPRYLSPVLPVFAYVGAQVYDRLLKSGVGPAAQTLFWLSLLPALALWIIVISVHSTAAQGVPLWSFYFAEIPRWGASRVLFKVVLGLSAMAMMSWLTLFWKIKRLCPSL